MKHKILLLLFLFSLLPSWGWGQEAGVTETIKLDELLGSFEINHPGEYTFIGKYGGSPTYDIGGGKKAVINVKADLVVTIILDNAKIDLSEGCPLSAKDAKMVNLKLISSNTLISGIDCPGIWAPEGENCGIIIDEESGSSGSLIVKTSSIEYPGIGGMYNQSANSYITINGGTINATAAYGAGIGGGINYSKNNITITITGGTVTATSNYDAGIGDGYSNSGSTFSTGKSGNAFINASSISDDSYKSNQTTSGIIFDNNKTGKFYGSSVTLSDNATLASGQSLTISDTQTLTIAKGATLTIAQGATLTNKGTIKCDGEINGTISGNVKVQYAVTYNPNYDNIPADHIKYVESGKSLPDYNVNRDYYTFAGWSKDQEGNNKVGNITGATTVYAHWEPIQFNITNQIELEETYGKPFDFTFTDNNIEGNILDAGGIESISWNNPYDIPDYLNLTNVVLFGTPTSINENGSTFSFKVTAINGATADMEMKFKVNKADLTITHDNPITKVYDGNNTVTIPNALKLEGVYSDDDVYLGSYTLTYDDEKAGIDKEITNLGSYTLTGEKKDNYNLIIPPDFALTGTITRAPLTITPKPNQKLFEGETPAYEVIGEVNNETPKFTGSLGVESGKVVINSLALTTEFAQNYSLSLTPDIPITIINNETAKSLVQLNGTTNANGAYIDEVTFTAPEGFLIALESSKLKSRLNYTKSFTWNQKGTSILNYKLKRISDSRESGLFSMEITVESKYIPDNGGNDNNDSSITEYNIEIPEVEGISIDEGFGDHWIKDWKDFSFIITVKEGYVENSDPEVTIKGYDFEFDALTDTTYECKIDHVYKNAEVTITGIVKDPPATANNAIKAPQESWKIVNGVAYITVAKPTIFAVVDMKGNIISTNKLAPGETPIYNLPRAKPIVFWFDKERAVKVIIK